MGGSLSSRFAGLRRMPAPLVAAQVGAIAVALYGIVGALIGWRSWRNDSMSSTLVGGSWFALDVLLVAGLGALRHRLVVPGVRLAWVAAMLQPAVQLAYLGVWFYTSFTDAHSDHLWQANTISALVLALGLAVGLGLATRRRRWVAIGVVVAIVTHPPWFVDAYLYDALTVELAYALTHGLALVFAVTMLTVASIACGDATTPTVADWARGLRRIARALHGTSIAAILAIAFGLLAEVFDIGPQLLAGSELVVVLATTASFACLVLFALGALAASRGGGLPGGLFVASAIASLAVAGTLLFRILDLVQRYFLHQHGSFRTRISFPGSQPALVQSLSAQLLVATAIVFVLVATAIAARRRGLEELRGRTMVYAGVFVGLALAAMAAEEAVIHAYELSNPGIALVVGATFVIVTGWVLAARIVRRAADAFDGGPSLPVATLVR